MMACPSSHNYESYRSGVPHSARKPCDAVSKKWATSGVVHCSILYTHSTQYTLYSVHLYNSLYTICSKLYTVHNIQGSYNKVHKAYTKIVQTLYKAYAKFIQSLHKAYAKLIQSLHKAYAKLTQSFFKAYTKLIQSLCKAYTKLIQSLYKAYTELMQSSVLLALSKVMNPD